MSDRCPDCNTLFVNAFACYHNYGVYTVYYWPPPPHYTGNRTIVYRIRRLFSHGAYVADILQLKELSLLNEDRIEKLLVLK